METKTELLKRKAALEAELEELTRKIELYSQVKLPESGDVYRSEVVSLLFGGCDPENLLVIPFWNRSHPYCQKYGFSNNFMNFNKPENHVKLLVLLGCRFVHNIKAEILNAKEDGTLDEIMKFLKLVKGDDAT